MTFFPTQIAECVFLESWPFCCCLTAEVSTLADAFVLATDNGTVFLTSQGQTMTSLTGVHDVGVLGFDWLTDTLYWTNSKLNIVCIVFVSSHELYTIKQYKHKIPDSCFQRTSAKSVFVVFAAVILRRDDKSYSAEFCSYCSCTSGCIDTVSPTVNDIYYKHLVPII